MADCQSEPEQSTVDSILTGDLSITVSQKRIHPSSQKKITSAIATMLKFLCSSALYFALSHTFYAAAASTTMLSESGRALLESRIIDQLDANAKRCLVDDMMNPDLCRDILLDPLHNAASTNDSTFVISEASYEVESPAPLEGDRIGSDMGEPQVIDAYNHADIVEVIRQARVYMQEVVHQDPQYEKVRKTCTNDNTQCAFWASIGECEKVRKRV